MSNKKDNPKSKTIHPKVILNYSPLIERVAGWTKSSISNFMLVTAEIISLLAQVDNDESQKTDCKCEIEAICEGKITGYHRNKMVATWHVLQRLKTAGLDINILPYTWSTIAYHIAPVVGQIDPMDKGNLQARIIDIRKAADNMTPYKAIMAFHKLHAPSETSGKVTVNTDDKKRETLADKTMNTLVEQAEVDMEQQDIEYPNTPEKPKNIPDWKSRFIAFTNMALISKAAFFQLFFDGRSTEDFQVFSQCYSDYLDKIHAQANEQVSILLEKHNQTFDNLTLLPEKPEKPEKPKNKLAVAIFPPITTAKS